MKTILVIASIGWALNLYSCSRMPGSSGEEQMSQAGAAIMAPIPYMVFIGNLIYERKNQ